MANNGLKAGIWLGILVWLWLPKLNCSIRWSSYKYITWSFIHHSIDDLAYFTLVPVDRVDILSLWVLTFSENAFLFNIFRLVIAKLAVREPKVQDLIRLGVFICSHCNLLKNKQLIPIKVWLLTLSLLCLLVLPCCWTSGCSKTRWSWKSISKIGLNIKNAMRTETYQNRWSLTFLYNFKIYIIIYKW